MHRTLLPALALVAASFGAHAQQKPVAATDATLTAGTTAPAKARPRNAVSQAIADLMRAAREQHDTQAGAKPAVTPAATPAAHARAKAPDAPVLADSGGSGR